MSRERERGERIYVEYMYRAKGKRKIKKLSAAKDPDRGLKAD